MKFRFVLELSASFFEFFFYQQNFSSIIACYWEKERKFLSNNTTNYKIYTYLTWNTNSMLGFWFVQNNVILTMWVELPCCNGHLLAHTDTSNGSDNIATDSRNIEWWLTTLLLLVKFEFSTDVYIYK